MGITRADVACLWISCSLLVAATAHAGMRWGLELGSRLGTYGPEAPFSSSPRVPPNESRARFSWDGGVLAEWPAGRRLVLGAGLRYEEVNADLHRFTGLTLSNGGQDVALWEDRTMRLRGLSLAPNAGIRFGPGFRLVFGPELFALMQAKQISELSPGPVQLQRPALRPEGQIFEQVGSRVVLDVTGRYPRWIPGMTVDAGWEHPAFGHSWRVDVGYHFLFSDPGSDDPSAGRIQTLRLALAWMH